MKKLRRSMAVASGSHLKVERGFVTTFFVLVLSIAVIVLVIDDSFVIHR